MHNYFELSSHQEKTIQTNLNCQRLNNAARIRELRKYASDKMLIVFDSIPGLLSVNNPKYIGYVDAASTPFGIHFSNEKSWLTETEPDRNLFPEICLYVDHPAIECLLLIGSSGSVGHTAASDLDYWVCYNPEVINKEQLGLLNKKLSLISAWAQNEYEAEVNFYLVNLTDLVHGHLIKAWGAETEGEVAPLLLLEEMYRTMVHITGRFPLWIAWPVEGNPMDYSYYAHFLAPISFTGHPPKFIDLGFPHLPKPQEYLSAALWLSRKSDADPFKGLLKLMTILVAVESGFHAPQLCNLVKKTIFDSLPEQYPIDPYIIMINVVTAYGDKNLSEAQLDLLRVAAVLKVLGLGGQNSAPSLQSDSHKWTALQNWSRRWGWDPNRLFKISLYNQWTEREKLEQADNLMELLLNLYRRIANHLFSHYPEQVSAQDENLTALAARMLSRQKGFEATVSSLPAFLADSGRDLNLALYRSKTDKTWQLYAYQDPDAESFIPKEEHLLYSTPRVVKIAAWLVNNRLSGRIDNALYLIPPDDQTDVTEKSFKALVEKLAQLFPPVDYEKISKNAAWRTGASGPVLVAINMEKPAHTESLDTIDLVYRTGWGEMRHVCVDLDEYKSSADKYLIIVQTLSDTCETTPENLVFFTTASSFIQRAVTNLKVAMAAQNRQAKTPIKSGSASKSRIDRD